jgi:hypothetical protein
VTFTLPGEPWATAYDVVIDTSHDTTEQTVVGDIQLAARSLLLLRAHR